MKPAGHIKIGELAHICGLSVRTLHYYEEIGLLVPGRSKTQYRLYSPDDVLRLQQILIKKSMGLSLEQIKAALDAPDFDYRSALQNQREHLERQIRQNKAQIRSINAAIAQIDVTENKDTFSKDVMMTKTSLFDGFDPQRYEAEAKHRWNETEAYEESRKRTAQYSDKDWAKMTAELNLIWTDAATLMSEGVAPDSEAGGTIVERHRAYIERWFYPCSPAMHRGLSDMWLSDERFRENIDRFGPGLTAWVTDAIKALV